MHASSFEQKSRAANHSTKQNPPNSSAEWPPNRRLLQHPDHVHLYGMTPNEVLRARGPYSGAYLSGAVKDPLGNKIGSDIAQVVARVSANGDHSIGVVDRFAGSCNGLYAIRRHLPGAKGIGFEVEPAVFDLTTRNMAHLNRPSAPTGTLPESLNALKQGGVRIIAP